MVAVGLIGGAIEGILDGEAVAREVFVVGRSDDGRHLSLGIVLRQEVAVVVGALRIAPARVELEELIESVLALWAVGIVVAKSLEGGCGQGEILQFVFFDDAGIVEAVADNIVGSGLGLVREGNLLEIVGALVGVVGQGIFGCGGNGGGVALEGILEGGEGVFGRIVIALVVCGRGQHGFVGAPPVVLVLAASPLAEEVLFALLHEWCVVEVPILLLLARVLSVHLR